MDFLTTSKKPTDTSNQSELLTKIGEVQVAYDGKINEIKGSLNGHINELKQVKDLLQGKIKEIEDGKGKLSKEKEDALNEMQKIIGDINNNKSITDLKTSVDSVKTTSEEMKTILGIKGNEVSSNKDDYNNTFDATKTTILQTEDPTQLPVYGKRMLDDYFKLFPNSVFKNDVSTTGKITSKNLKQGELDGIISKYDEKTKTVIKNLRNKIVTQYRKLVPSLATQFGGYLSTHHKRHSKAKRTAKRNFFKFNRNINKHNKTKRRRSKKHHKRRK